MRPFLLSFDCPLRCDSTSRAGTAHTFSCFVIFQLLYSFACVNMSKIFAFRALRRRKLVENNGFEPLTPCLQSRCSSQLS
jgi:hypothetical protein